MTRSISSKNLTFFLFFSSRLIQHEQVFVVMRSVSEFRKRFKAFNPNKSPRSILERDLNILQVCRWKINDQSGIWTYFERVSIKTLNMFFRWRIASFWLEDRRFDFGFTHCLNSGVKHYLSTRDNLFSIIWYDHFIDLFGV